MIKNREQYEITKEELDKFSKRIEEMKEAGPGSDPTLFRMKLGGLKVAREDLRNQMDSYDRILSETPPSVAECAMDIPMHLIKSRISSGITEEDLAKRVGLQESDIRGYESTEYTTAETSHIKNIAGALGVKIQDGLLRRTKLGNIHKRLEGIGIRSDLVYRVLPPDLLDCVDDPKGATDLTRMRLAESLASTFNIDFMQLISGRSHLAIKEVDKVEYMLPGNVEKQKLLAYTAYVDKVADVMAKAAGRIDLGEIPGDPYAVLRSIRGDAEDMTLPDILDYAWSNGVPTVALNDPGMFRGASLDKNGRHVIMLNQVSDLESRWMFVMLHEIYHIAKKSSTMHMRSRSQGDRSANMFAFEVMLGGRSDELVNMCFERIGCETPSLQEAVHMVAQDEGVVLAILADRVEYEFGIEPDVDAPYYNDVPIDLHATVNDMFLKHSDLKRLDEQEIRLLQSALYYGPPE